LVDILSTCWCILTQFGSFLPMVIYMLCYMLINHGYLTMISNKFQILCAFIMNYLPLNSARNSNSGGGNSKTKTCDPLKIFWLKMFLISYFYNMTSLMKCFKFAFMSIWKNFFTIKIFNIFLYNLISIIHWSLIVKKWSKFKFKPVWHRLPVWTSLDVHSSTGVIWENRVVTLQPTIPGLLRAKLVLGPPLKVILESAFNSWILSECSE
jgi:hypothetical protein